MGTCTRSEGSVVSGVGWRAALWILLKGSWLGGNDINSNGFLGNWLHRAPAEIWCCDKCPPTNPADFSLPQWAPPCCGASAGDRDRDLLQCPSSVLSCRSCCGTDLSWGWGTKPLLPAWKPHRAAGQLQGICWGGDSPPQIPQNTRKYKLRVSGVRMAGMPCTNHGFASPCSVCQVPSCDIHAVPSLPFAVLQGHFWVWNPLLLASQHSSFQHK